MLILTTQLLFSAKSHLSPPPIKKKSEGEREYLRLDEINDMMKFVSERHAPLTTRTIRHIIARAGKLASIPFPVHPHQLRHACGYYLASQGHDTRAIQAPIRA